MVSIPKMAEEFYCTSMGLADVNTGLAEAVAEADVNTGLAEADVNTGLADEAALSTGLAEVCTMTGTIG